MIYVNNNICIENNQFSLRMVKFEDAKTQRLYNYLIAIIVTKNEYTRKRH